MTLYQYIYIIVTAKYQRSYILASMNTTPSAGGRPLTRAPNYLPSSNTSPVAIAVQSFADSHAIDSG